MREGGAEGEEEGGREGEGLSGAREGARKPEKAGRVRRQQLRGLARRALAHLPPPPLLFPRRLFPTLRVPAHRGG